MTIANNDADFPMYRRLTGLPLSRLVSSPPVSARRPLDLKVLVGGGGGRRRCLVLPPASGLLLFLTVGCRRFVGGGVVSVGCLVVVSWRGCCFVDVVRGFDFDPLLCWLMRYLRRRLERFSSAYKRALPLVPDIAYDACQLSYRAGCEAYGILPSLCSLFCASLVSSLWLVTYK